MKYNLDNDCIQQYLGIPNIVNAEEATLFAGFVALINSTLSHPQDGDISKSLSELIISEAKLRKARADKESATADLIRTQVQKMMQNIAEDAARMEREKLSLSPITGTSANLVNDFNDLQEKIKKMEIIYGLKLSVNLTD